MSGSDDRRVSSADEPPAETITRLQQECEQLRWERDQLAAQATNVGELWQQLAEMAAECDHLRAKVEFLMTELSKPGGPQPAKVQTDQLAWIMVALNGCLPGEPESVTRP